MFNYITIGYDCSPAAALRNAELREFALPFDWVVSNLHSLQRCFEDNFKQFHTNLQFNRSKTRLIDAYGFQFPHDYPLYDVSDSQIGEGVFGEEAGKTIIADWSKHYALVKEKYARRIERFNTIMHDPAPIIVLCRYSHQNVIDLRQMIAKYYKKTNVIFVNATTQQIADETIISCHTERNNVWNDPAIWKEGLDKARDLIGLSAKI